MEIIYLNQFSIKVVVNPSLTLTGHIHSTESGLFRAYLHNLNSNPSYDKRIWIEGWGFDTENAVKQLKIELESVNV